MLYILNKDLEAIGICVNSGGDACPYFNDELIETLQNGAQTYQFETPADHETAALINSESYIMRSNARDDLMLFKVRTITEKKSASGEVTKHVFAESAALELLHDIVRPIRLQSTSAETALAHVLQGTEWQIGVVEWLGVNLFEFLDFPTVLNAIQKINDLYGGDIVFRVEYKNGRVIGKYVDLLQQRGTNDVFRFDYTQDIIEIERIEDSSNLVTALIGVGASDDEGNPRTFAEIERTMYLEDGTAVLKPRGLDYVQNPQALQRHGRNGKHRFGVYKTEETDAIVILNRTWEQLLKSSDPQISYSVKVLDLARLQNGSEFSHKEAQLGDSGQVVDYSFDPPLIINARIIERSTSFTDPAQDGVVIGNFIPYEVTEIELIQQLQETIRQRSGTWETGSSGQSIWKGPTPPEDPELDLLWLDTSRTPNIWYRYDGTRWIKASPTTAQEVGAITPTDAANLASAAEQNAISTAANDATQKASAAQQAAIQTAATDAANKAAAAQQAAEAAAAEYTRQQAAAAEQAAILAAAETAAQEAEAARIAAEQNAALDASAKAQAAQEAAEAAAALLAAQEASAAQEAAIAAAATDAANKAAEAQAAAEAAAAADATNKANAAQQNAISTAASDATSKANTAQQNAISTAANDATNKANTAQQNAISTANSYTDGAITGVRSDLQDFVVSYAQKAISQQSTAPASPQTGDLWIDTSTTPHVWKRWNGSAWVKANPTSLSELSGQIQNAQLATNAVRAANILDGAITTNKIAANAITALKIAADAVTSTHIAAGAITSEMITTAGLDAGVIKFGTMSGDRILANSLDARALKAGSVIAEDITFSGTLEGATGTFSGSVVVGDPTNAVNPLLTLQSSGVLQSRLYTNVTSTEYTDRSMEISAAQLRFYYESNLNGLNLQEEALFTMGSNGLEISGQSLQVETSAFFRYDFVHQGQLAIFDGQTDFVGNVNTNGTNRFYGPTHFHGNFATEGTSQAFFNGARVEINPTGETWIPKNGTAIFKVDRDSYFGGNKYINNSEFRSFVQERGYCGLGTLGGGAAAGAQIGGVGVNFRTKKTYTPSSIILGGYSTYNGNPHVADIRVDGFWLYLTQNVGGFTGHAYWRGYYEG